jgi:hypothetical protein
MSTSLYNTFGNQIKYDVVADTLVAYLENATIKFPLPEASADILSKLTDPQTKNFDPAKYFMVNSKLVKLGFKKPNADALTDILMQVATAQNIDPLDYFSINTNTLNLTLDAYRAINNLRPVGSRVGVIFPTQNSKSRVATLIRR